MASDTDFQTDVEVSIPIGNVEIGAALSRPAHSKGLVLFAHGSGSSRFSPRNRFVADALNDAGVSTLLIDLLTPSEAALDNETAELRFNIKLLADRLIGATRWAREQPALKSLPIGYFGASTGAAAALEAAVVLRDEIAAIVSRGGRPDLATQLGSVRAPTLLIVGGADTSVLALNRQASNQMKAKREIYVIPGATHLFEEPGALADVAKVAASWFVSHFQTAQGS